MVEGFIINIESYVMIFDVVPGNNVQTVSTDDSRVSTLVTGSASKRKTNLDLPQDFSKNYHKHTSLFNVWMVVPKSRQSIDKALKNSGR